MMKQKKRAHGSEIVRVRENGGASQRQDKQQAPTNGLKLYARAAIESEAWPDVVQLKRKQ